MTASKCPAATAAFYVTKSTGEFVVYVPGTSIAAVNAELAKLNGIRNITYMDIGKVFLEADGSISPAIMNDYLHPTEAGYERWGEAIAPTLKNL